MISSPRSRIELLPSTNLCKIGHELVPGRCGWCYADPLAPQRAWHRHNGPVAINVYEIVQHQGGHRSSIASPCHLVKRCIGPPSASAALCVDALSGDVNLWRWIDVARWPNPTAGSGDTSVSACEAADDIHGYDALTAAVDFDDWGNEIDDTTGLQPDTDDRHDNDTDHQDLLVVVYIQV